MKNPTSDAPLEERVEQVCRALSDMHDRAHKRLDKYLRQKHDLEQVQDEALSPMCQAMEEILDPQAVVNTEERAYIRVCTQKFGAEAVKIALQRLEHETRSKAH